MVESDLRYGVVGVDIAIQVGLFHILQRIFIGFLFQQITFARYFKHTYRTPFFYNVYIITKPVKSQV